MVRFISLLLVALLLVNSAASLRCYLGYPGMTDTTIVECPDRSCVVGYINKDIHARVAGWLVFKLSSKNLFLASKNTRMDVRETES
jgi:hypothetical protein